jgi:hypothetical protein
VSRLVCVVLASSGVVLLAACGSAHSTAATAQHGSLSAHEFAVAARIARSEADRLAKTITSATATASRGTVRDSNTGHPCTSGTLLQIKLLGTFKIVVSPPPGEDDTTVTEVDITADPGAGKACLISVRTAAIPPSAAAATLPAG